MSHSAGHHIEHAEHAAHSAHDSFNTQVTITIAIIAAALAGVTILGHKAHNMMLSKQLEASALSNKGFNKWAQFQAYNIRSHLYQIAVDEAEIGAMTPGTEEVLKKVKARWKGQVDKYENKSMPETKEEALEFDRKADALLEAAHDYHFKAEWLDLGDLGLQLGVVLASLAILTKRRSFWFLGIACALVGLGTAMGAQFGIIKDSRGHAEHPSADHGKGEHKSAPTKNESGHDHK